MMHEKIYVLIRDAVTHEFGVVDAPDFSIAPPENPAHGDYATNVAMVVAKIARVNPMEVAERIKSAIAEHELIGRIEVAKPGFINFFLKDSMALHMLGQVLESADTWGASDIGRGKTVMVEYTDPNPFKQFHIGHLMSNAIRESISRLP